MRKKNRVKDQNQRKMLHNRNYSDPNLHGKVNDYKQIKSTKNS